MDTGKRIYIICPVRNGDIYQTDNIRRYAAGLRESGHTVHFPPDDAPQSDPIGTTICEVHRSAMLACDEVHIFWDSDSKGSHFDLGMAYVLHKKLVPIRCFNCGPQKSYWNALLQERYQRGLG
jgi:hypothetical protein